MFVLGCRRVDLIPVEQAVGEVFPIVDSDVVARRHPFEAERSVSAADHHVSVHTDAVELVSGRGAGEQGQARAVEPRSVDTVKHDANRRVGISAGVPDERRVPHTGAAIEPGAELSGCYDILYVDRCTMTSSASSPSAPA